LLPATNAVNQALNDTESSVLVWSASRSARLALVRSADARASDTDDSVLHFAAANPEYAASSATTDSTTASTIDSHCS